MGTSNSFLNTDYIWTLETEGSEICLALYDKGGIVARITFSELYKLCYGVACESP